MTLNYIWVYNVSMDEISQIRFGKLCLISNVNISSGSTRKVLWMCDCGRTAEKRIGNVVRGITKTCGRCNEISAEEMMVRKFGKLRMRDPSAVTTGSGKKVIWVCDCGREVNTIIHSVVRDGTSSCGKCDEIHIPIWDKYGKLSVKYPIDTMPNSHNKIEWVCDCGNKTKAQIRYVLNGIIKSCGRCNEISAEIVGSTKYGRLRIKDPITVKSGSNKKTWWVCDCGREVYSQIVAVIQGRARSCGKCWLSFKTSYDEHKQEIRALKTPITPEQLPDWCPIALETITKVSIPFRAKCRLCGGEYYPRWSSIRLGQSLTCGRSVSRVSYGQNEIFDFIRNKIEAKLEHKIDGLLYDIFIPSRNLVIEFNGLKWHSRQQSKRRDIQKWKNAMACGINFIAIFEDEWKYRRSQVETLLVNRLGLTKSKQLRPKECVIKSITKHEANEFLNLYHYIGGISAPVNYGAFYEGALIACISFKRPTRQSSYDWELSRMAANPLFRVHGIWSKLLNQFVNDHNPKSIVSFSDNRLFTGNTYRTIGFILDKELRPDYYWCKGNNRVHKSTMRKTKYERLTGKSEAELREAQGYSKIWDYGKKRWLWHATVNH